MNELSRAAEARRYDTMMAQAERRVMTAAVGALASMEEAFGALWGLDKEEQDRTEEQKRWLNVWAASRTEVLDNANRQVRALHKEIERGLR